MTAKITFSKPEGGTPPSAGYSHAGLVGGETRRLIVSGQVGRTRDGTVPHSGEAQIAVALTNLRAILEANGMEPRHVIRTTLFVTDHALLAPMRAARNAFFDGHMPASTVLVVAGLADPQCFVEIEAEAV